MSGEAKSKDGSYPMSLCSQEVQFNGRCWHSRCQEQNILLLQSTFKEVIVLLICIVNTHVLQCLSSYCCHQCNAKQPVSFFFVPYFRIHHIICAHWTGLLRLAVCQAILWSNQPLLISLSESSSGPRMSRAMRSIGKLTLYYPIGALWPFSGCT